MTPLELLKWLVAHRWLEEYYPLKHCVYDPNTMATVGELIDKTISDAETQINKEVGMKYFRAGSLHTPCGKNGIILDTIFSIEVKEADEKIIIREERDGCCIKVFTSVEAIEMFQEAIEYIKQNTK